jgi:glycosyltransferase involved in cell wall biosynthesis
MSTEKITDPSTTGIVISFIVPAYNEEAELPGTLRAIRSAAAGYEHEIVLVNDGSTDATGAIGEKFGARVISIERRQIAAARNAGAAAARGNVFIFVDADTRIGPEHVRGAVAALERNCAGGGARLDTDREIPLWGRIFFRDITPRGPPKIQERERVKIFQPEYIRSFRPEVMAGSRNRLNRPRRFNATVKKISSLAK